MPEEQKFSKLIESFPTKKIIVIGDYCLDEYIYGDTNEISPEFPVLRLYVNEKKYSPGAAGNVSSGVSALDAKTFSVGVVGNDINGGILIQELNKKGINTEGLFRVEKRNTPTYTRIVYEGKRRPKQHVARLDIENTEQLEEETRNKIKEFLIKKIPDVDAVIVADYEEVDNTGIINQDIIDTISSQVKKYNKKCFAVSRKRISYFKNFTTVIPNDLEAMKATDSNAKTDEDFKIIAEKLLKMLNIEASIITRGAEGISVLENNKWSTFPTAAKIVVDVCGAGDTVTCTTALSILSGATYQEAAILGNLAASITVSKEGTASVTRQELLNLIIDRKELTKLRTIKEIKDISNELKNKNKKVVFINGYFDPIHIGHIELLTKAKKLGDILIVGLNSDKSVRENKGPNRPYMLQNKRAEILNNLECIDYIVLFDELTPIKVIEEIKPNIIAKGNNYKKEEVVGKEILDSYGGEVILLDVIQGISSDQILSSIIGRKEYLKNKITKTLEKQKGILFAEPAIVYRYNYSGRDIIAKNSKFEPGYTDDRGYVPVEWWIMSKTEAENEKMKENEGLSQIYLDNEMGQEKVLFKDAVEVMEEKLLGIYSNVWPLTKILDIGGQPIKPSFSNTEEIPPIPCHVHSGKIINGKSNKKGKLEAYFFPPTNVAPYNTHFGKTITRLGLKPNTTKEQVIEKLKQFGKNDEMYELCNVYEINAYDGWTIPPFIIHAPGPWTTFEIQLPQDDYNLLSWQLGKRFSEEQLKEQKESSQLRGLSNEETMANEVIDWELSTHPNFKEKFHRPKRVIQQGPWGRQLQIFFDQFYGEAFEIDPNQTWIRNSDSRPFAGIVWSGKGLINDNIIDVNNKERKEFLVTPNTPITIKNTGDYPLLIYTVFPINTS